MKKDEVLSVSVMLPGEEPWGRARFLEQILLSLKIGGTVKRNKAGRGGGYQLSMPPDQITIGSIIRICHEALISFTVRE